MASESQSDQSVELDLTHNQNYVQVVYKYGKCKGNGSIVGGHIVRVNSKELSIELIDFSVFYNQDATEETAESLRPGGAKVVVENGQVVKILKDKVTEKVSREVLTKKWSDWIDYWAVDYNFADRKEIISEIDKDGKLVGRWTGDYIFDNEWQSFRTKEK